VIEYNYVSYGHLTHVEHLTLYESELSLLHLVIHWARLF